MIAALARAQQDAVWNRQQLANQLRSLLREYCPAALKAFHAKNIGLSPREARAVLRAAPTPAAAAKPTARPLHASGQQRNIATWTSRLQALFGEEHLHQLPLVEKALGRQPQALLLQLNAACRAADDLAEATSEAFHQLPDAAAITSFPGLADLTGAQVLAELRDDRVGFADARALKAYAGAVPITRTSGKSLVIHHREVKDQRLPPPGTCGPFAPWAPVPRGQALRPATRRKATGTPLQRATRHLQPDARLPAPLPAEKQDL